MDQEIILYGAGKRCKTLCEILRWSNIHIKAIIDSNENRWGEDIGGYLIQTPDRIQIFQNTYICITVWSDNEAKKIRTQYQEVFCFNSIKEIGYNELILKAYKENHKIEYFIRNHMIAHNREKTALFDCYQGLILGGVEAWTQDICRELILKGWNNTYIISDGGTYDMEERLSDHVISVDINHDISFSPSSVLNLIEVIMSKLPCKVVTCSTDEVMLAAYLVKRFYPDHLEIISVIHNSCKMVYEAYSDFRECIDFYIGVSQDIRNDMIERGIVPEQICSMTCPFPCEQDLLRTYTEDYKKPICVGYAGRMDRIDNIEYSQKRMDLLLKCLNVLQKRKVNFVMELAGDGPGRIQMEKYVFEHNLNSQVKFLGKLERTVIPGFWRKQDICVNFSDFEGRSISIIEAMGNGAIPIVTGTSGTREDITDGKNGYIVLLGDYITVADRIEYLANHREYLQDMGKFAHDDIYPKSLMKPHIKFWERILFSEDTEKQSI